MKKKKEKKQLYLSRRDEKRRMSKSRKIKIKKEGEGIKTEIKNVPVHQKKKEISLLNFVITSTKIYRVNSLI